MENTKN
jgi:hypothetical protein